MYVCIYACILYYAQFTVYTHDPCIIFSYVDFQMFENLYMNKAARYEFLNSINYIEQYIVYNNMKNNILYMTKCRTIYSRIYFHLV